MRGWWSSSSSSGPAPAESSKSTPPSAPLPPPDAADSIYAYYRETLGPALVASIPLLAQKLMQDAGSWTRTILPTLVARQEATAVAAHEWFLKHQSLLLNYSHLHNNNIKFANGTTAEDILKELLELLPSTPTSSSWAAFFSREWPLLEWKVGVWLWRTFGTFLTVVAILTVIPGRLHGWSGRILRWPILGLTYVLVLVELAVYIVIRLGIRAAEYVFARPKHRQLRYKMAQSKSYEEWFHYAQELDQSQGRDEWIRHVDDNTSYVYNWTFVKELLTDLKQARQQGDALTALAVIQQCTRKNVGGIMSEDLFSYTNTGEPKALVREFIHEVVTTMHWLTEQAQDDNDEQYGNNHSDVDRSNRQVQKKIHAEKDKLWKSLASFLDLNHHHDKSRPSSPGSPSTTIYKSQVLQFLRRARASYGRTALCLSGGSMMGVYHFGHVRSLLETGCLPHIISGTSAGSIIGAILCTRTDDELDNDMRPEVLVHKLICFSRPWGKRIRSLIQTGSMFDVDEWMDLLGWFCRGDMTFAEAYQRTGRVFCITLSSTTKRAPPVLINYLSAPDVTIASAVVASAAVPGFIPPVRLRVKGKDGVVRFQGTADETYYDGSIKQDIPVNGLAEMLNCQFFIAAQCNPHINPFFFNSKGGVGRPCRWSSGDQEDSWRGGFLLAALELYLKNDMKAKMVFLRDLDAAVGFTSELMTQDYVGSTTIVPQTTLPDYFQLLENPSLEQLRRCFQAGTVAAYEHTVMIRMHYSIADALDHCIAKLDPEVARRHRRRSKLGPPLPMAVKFATATTAGSIGEVDEAELDAAKEAACGASDLGDGSQASETLPSSDNDEFESNWVDIQ